MFRAMSQYSSLASKIISGNLSLKKDYIIKLELSNDWQDYLSICKKEFQDNFLYEQMYPDDEKRRRFLDCYYQYRYRSDYQNGRGRLSRFLVEYLKLRLLIGCSVNFRSEQRPVFTFS